MAATAPSIPVVLTGANGFIGRQVLEALLARGLQVWTVTRKPLLRPPAGSSRALHEIVAPDGQYHSHLPDLPAFALVHCAWCRPDRTQGASHAEQVQLMARTLDSQRGRIARVIALGSAEEYGPREGCLGEEDVPGEPVSSYAWGKQAVRSLLQWWSGTHGVPAIWLRPFTVYGEGQQGDMVIPFAIGRAVGKQVAQFSGATQRRDFIHVSDVAAGIAASVAADLCGFNVINLGTGVPTELLQVLKRISAHLQARELFQYGVLPMRPNEPGIQYADIGRAKQLLQWSSAVPLDAGIARLCEYQLARL